MKTVAIGIIVIAVLVAIIMGVYNPVEQRDPELCYSNEDCVPAQCCHSTSCVLAKYAPDCTDVMCTMDCRPGTMDCGQGECVCNNGVCEAVIWG